MIRRIFSYARIRILAAILILPMLATAQDSAEDWIDSGEYNKSLGATMEDCDYVFGSPDSYDALALRQCYADVRERHRSIDKLTSDAIRASK